MLKQLASLNVLLLERVVLSGTSLPKSIQDSILLILETWPLIYCARNVSRLVSVMHLLLLSDTISRLLVPAVEEAEHAQKRARRARCTAAAAHCRPDIVPDRMIGRES